MKLLETKLDVFYDTPMHWSIYVTTIQLGDHALAIR
jgi:hypothetical protein